MNFMVYARPYMANMAASNSGEVPGPSPGSICPSSMRNWSLGTFTISILRGDGEYRSRCSLFKSSFFIRTSPWWLTNGTANLHYLTHLPRGG